MMICKAIKGAGARGLFDYLLRDGRGQILRSGSMAGRTPRELAAEIGQYRKLNPKLRKAVAHFSLSPSPDDPLLTDEQWESVATRFMSEMGFADAAWVAVLHREPGHIAHAHIAACRVDASGKTVSDANDFRRAEAAVRGIEEDFGLTAVDSSHTKPKPAKSHKARPKRRRQSNNNNPPEITMQEPANQNPSTTSTPTNPFEPGTASHAIWPQPFNLSAVLSEFSMVKQRGYTAPGACVGVHLTNSQRRNIQRIRQDPHYADLAHQALGDQLAWVSKTDFGQVLLFREPGQIMDCGDNLTALGGMDDALAAKRIVALAIQPEREWKSIRFTGRAQFLEFAFREALDHNLPIHTTGDEQKAILAKIIAERAGGMGASSGPSHDPAEILRELDDLPAQTVTRTAPKPMPVALPPASKSPESAPAPQQQPQPVVGVTPMFLNLRERLHDSRFRPTVKTGPHAPTTAPKGGPKSP